MSQLCFATFARALQKVLIQPSPDYKTRQRQQGSSPSKARPKMTSTDAYVVEILLRWIQDTAPVEDKDGFAVWRSGKTVSDLLGQKTELHTGFGPVLLDPELPKAGIRAFAEIKKDINPLRRADFKEELATLIKEDPEVSAEAAQELLNAAQISDEVFYTLTFMSAASRPNKKREDNGARTEEGLLLAARNGDVCPICGKERLIKTIKQERFPLLEMVTFPIDDDGNETAQEAVCLKCAKLVLGGPALFHDSDVVEKLRQVRIRRIAADGLLDRAVESQLHPAITEIVATLGERITSGRTPTLTLDAVPVAQKIRPEFYELSQRIKINVLEWYRIIEEEFSEADSHGRNRFTIIAAQVADFYDSAVALTDDQQEIFNAVAQWIHTNSDSTDWNASVLVASFFVQNCEVFDEIA